MQIKFYKISIDAENVNKKTAQLNVIFGISIPNSIQVLAYINKCRSVNGGEAALTVLTCSIAKLGTSEIPPSLMHSGHSFEFSYLRQSSYTKSIESGDFERATGAVDMRLRDNHAGIRKRRSCLDQIG